MSRDTSLKISRLDGATDSVAEPHVLTVADLTRQIKDCLNVRFASVWVAGEICDLARPPSGHVYLTLKDADAQLRAVVWRNTVARLTFPLDDGMQVICQGEIDIYPPRGSYQLIIRQLEPRGEGAAQRALRQLQAKLAAEGLFDPRHKQPVPAFPRLVAVVTSPTGAAIRDFLEVARRRWLGAAILVIPARVQGEGAASEVAAAIKQANQLTPRPAALVVTRGGGSLEDLACFNDERVVRAIFASRVPVVSAVGHEIDVTLADLVADLRALTPSEAAERVLPSADELRDALRHLGQRLQSGLLTVVRQSEARLLAAAQRRVLTRPWERLHERSRRLDELAARAERAVDNGLASANDHLARLAAQLHALSPLAVLGRGYSLTVRKADQRVLRRFDEVQPGAQIQTRLAVGQITSRVETCQDEEPGKRPRESV